MHCNGHVQRLYYGLDHLNFYLRLDFQAGGVPGKNLPTELRLLWFYPGITQYNSPMPLADLPDQEPSNYLFHHHLGINLRTESIWLEEAGENYCWHSKATGAKMALDRCLELAVPWADLDIEPDYPLQLVTVLADDGKFRGCLPENDWVRLQAP